VAEDQHGKVCQLPYLFFHVNLILQLFCLFLLYIKLQNRCRLSTNLVPIRRNHPTQHEARVKTNSVVNSKILITHVWTLEKKALDALGPLALEALITAYIPTRTTHHAFAILSTGF
jgi:hypothetical protein